MATADGQMLRSKTCLIRFASSVARCQFGEDYHDCSGTSDVWSIGWCCGKATVEPLNANSSSIYDRGVTPQPQLC
ncbi:hypothetical protein V8C26DRAFT_388165 [Trichoderma gracile]